jgi:carbon-monoxide dehydrogenase medium subunit
VASFFKTLFTTALEPNEILTEIRIPVPKANSGGAYLKLERKVGDFATAGAAAYVVLDGAGAFESAGIGLTNVGLTPVKAVAAEKHLIGKKAEAIREAARLAGDAANPGADRRGSVEYKKEMARVLTARALKKAFERAGGR